MRQSTPDRPTRSGRRARLAEAKAADSLNALSFRTLAAELNGRMSSRSAGGSSDASGSPPQPARKNTLGDLRDPELSHTRQQALSLEVNKKIRQRLLHQHPLTNRFTGSGAARRVEKEYHAFVTLYQLNKVQRRLLYLAACLLAGTLHDGVTRENVAFALLRSVLPSCCLAFGALLARWETTRPWWRAIIIAAAVATYNCVVWADAAVAVDAWSPASKDTNTMWQLIWLLLHMQCVTLFALDLVPVALTIFALWASYVIASLTLYARWWSATQPRWTWEVQSNQDIEAVNATAFCAAWDAGVADGHIVRAAAGAGGDGDGLAHSPILLQCVLLSVAWLLVVLLAVRRLNRFERQSFVNSYVLMSKVSTQVAQIKGKQVELLALFSNPRAPPGAAGSYVRPLQLGQELKFLLRAVPTVHLAIEPAAGLADVEAAVKKHNPRIILFSGHSFMGSLAFELPNGRMQLPPASEFIACLGATLAPRLEAVFLNGCQTSDLGHQIVSQLPHLKAISWSTLTEDAAARSFALGFYDAVGSYVAAGSKVAIEEAYWAGIDRFREDGFALGDPAAFLHPPGHPHHLVPDFRGCTGCMPPVHGTVILLACVGGEDDGVQMLAEVEVDAGGASGGSLDGGGSKSRGKSRCGSPRKTTLDRGRTSSGGRQSRLTHSRCTHAAARLTASGAPPKAVDERWVSVTPEEARRGSPLAYGYGTSSAARSTIGPLSGPISGAIQSLERRLSGGSTCASCEESTIPARSGALPTIPDSPARGNGGVGTSQISTSCSRETTSSAAREGSRSSAERVVHQVKVEVVP